MKPFSLIGESLQNKPLLAADQKKIRLIFLARFLEVSILETSETHSQSQFGSLGNWIFSRFDLY